MSDGFSFPMAGSLASGVRVGIVRDLRVKNCGGTVWVGAAERGDAGMMAWTVPLLRPPKDSAVSVCASTLLV